MKSKLFVTTSALCVWLSSCADPEVSGVNADAGGLDAGSSSATSDESSSAGTMGETVGTSSSSASHADTSAVSSEAGVSGSDSSSDNGNSSSGASASSSNTNAVDTVGQDSGTSTADTSLDDSDTTEPDASASNDDTDVVTTDVSSDASTSNGVDAGTTSDDSVAVDDAGGAVDASADDSTTIVTDDGGQTDNDASTNTTAVVSTQDNNSGTSGTSDATLSLVVDAGADVGLDASSNDGSVDGGDDATNDASTTNDSDGSGSFDASADASTDTSSDTTTSDSTSTDDTSTDIPLTGQQLFEEATFGGNGRTCLTCHGPVSGSISAPEIQALFASDPNGPMFRPIDSNDGVGTDYSILLARATFRVEIPLPPGVTLVDDPSATSVVLRRSALSTINTPGLDDTLMWDGRAVDLMDQAFGAITGHAQSTEIPTQEQLELIAEFEQTDAFFSSDTLRDYYDGGAAPQWPAGNTAAEIRGRRWFAEDPVNAPRFNICGQCHGGPMTNETQQNSGLPVGEHFQTANVSEFNSKGNPTFTFRFPDPENPGQTKDVTTPDPGLALTTGDVRDVNFFKIPTLWGVSKTAPYFHDNSSATLEELMDHYEDHLATFLGTRFGYPFPHVPTAQDKTDIIAYLRLL